MAQVMLYVVPLLLGRTFDVNKMQVGVDIFPKDQVTNPMIIQNPITETKYKVIENSQDVRDFLDVGGSFSLNVKGGMFKAGASGSYLSDVYDRENNVEVAVRATYETVTMTLPEKAKPVDTWKSMGALGTHYVRSITYGGELIASIRMKTKNTRDKSHIKGALEVGGRIKIFDVGLEVEGEYMSDVTKNVDTMEIKVFSAVSLSRVPNDRESLNNMLKNFPDEMQKFNDGNGVPLKVELWPLEYLDSSRPQHIKNKVLDAHLADFETKFDDLLSARSAVTDWLKDLDKGLTNDQETKVGEFYTELETKLRDFYAVIGDLDMSKGSDQLKPALKAYGTGIPGTYYKKYINLREQVAADLGMWIMDAGRGITFTRYGQTKCTLGAELVYVGQTAGPDQHSGGTNYICLPTNDTYVGEVLTERSAAPIYEVDFHMPDGDKAALTCTVCRLATSGSVAALAGKTRCPIGWLTLYKGFLMGGENKNANTDFICLEHPPTKDVKSKGDGIVTTWSEVRGADEDNNERLVPCVMCAK